MKLICLIPIATLALLAQSITSAELIFGPESDEWETLYEPAFKSPEEVPRGSELRKTLFNLARPKLEKLAGQSIRFNGSLKAYRNWALFLGESVDANGNSIAYPDLQNSDTVVLFLRTADRWVVVDYSGGHGDVFYEIWIEQYGMPRPLLLAP
ncbi:MAG: hypothetical protein AAGA96_05290 [Verrucomicrobiota bacterium]